MAGSTSRFALPDLVRAFRDGERFGDATMRVLEVDHLVLPTGRIVACDPSYLTTRPAEQSAYTRPVPPGRYPVLLALLARDGFRADNPNRGCVACAALRFQETPVERWEMALRPGWDLSTLKPGFLFGYGVDGGNGCFVDECAVKRLPPGQPAFREAFQKAEANLHAVYQEYQAKPAEAVGRLVADPRWPELRHGMARAYDSMVPPGLGEVLGAVFDPGQVRGPAWSAVLDSETQANIVCFRSGEGDGSYASYFGLAADGTPAWLVTDFGLLVRSVPATLEIPIPVQEHSALTHPGLADIGIDRILVEWRPDEGKVVVDLGEALYVHDVRFENRAGPPARCTASSGDATLWFRLDEPLAPTARVLIEYTLRRVAL
jgi:hypothetical protein